MELKVVIGLFYYVMVSSAAEEEKKNLTAVVGGNITLDHPVLEEGFLFTGSKKTIAKVKNKILHTYEDDYQNRVLWNQTSGLFTITNLQRNSSGVYTIKLITPDRLITYLLTVIEPVPGPGPGPVPTAEPTPTTRPYWIVGVSVGGFLIGVLVVFVKMFLQSHSRNKQPGMRADLEAAELQNQEKQKSRKEEEESEEMMKTGPADEEELTAAAEHHQS